MKCEIKTLGEVAQYINGRAFKPSEWETSGKPIIRIQNLTGTSEKVNYSSKEYDEKYHIKKGDLLFAWSASLGAHIWAGEDAWLNQHIFKIVPNESMNKKYIYYFLQKVVAELYMQTHGSGMVHITKKPFFSTKIPVPPIAEQERIVARIEELFSQLDKAVETLQMVKEQLVVYRQAVLKDAFEGSLTNSIKIETVNLASLIEKPRYGTSKKCIYDKTETAIPVYRIPNINHHLGVVSHADLKYAEFANDELKALNLESDDLLLIRSNGSVTLVGRAALINQKDLGATFAGYLIRIRIKDTSVLRAKYLLLYLQSFEARCYIENKAKSTSGVHNINSEEIKELNVPLFEIGEQDKIIEAIEVRLSIYDKISETVESILNQTEAMRQSILKQAFEGELA